MATPPQSVFQIFCKRKLYVACSISTTLSTNTILIAALLRMSFLPSGGSHLGLDPWFHLPGYSLGSSFSVFLLLYFLEALSYLQPLQMNVISNVFKPWELIALLCSVVDGLLLAYSGTSRKSILRGVSDTISQESNDCRWLVHGKPALWENVKQHVFLASQSSKVQAHHVKGCLIILGSYHSA